VKSRTKVEVNSIVSCVCSQRDTLTGEKRGIPGLKSQLPSCFGEIPMDSSSRRAALRWKAELERTTLEVSRIIPGDWGKAGSGWLARPLLKCIARCGGRIHQFL